LILDPYENSFIITSVTPNKIDDTSIAFSGNKVEITIGENPINDADISINYIDNNYRKFTKILTLSAAK
jgi:hypothetical protein